MEGYGFLVSALHTRTAVNHGDHAQDVVTVVEVGSGETVQGLMNRLVFDPKGDSSYEDYITLRVVRPLADTEK